MIRRAFRPAAIVAAALIPVLAFAERPDAPLSSRPKRGHLAATVVRSNDWKMIRGAHEIEELTGNVYYRQSDREIRSDWARHDIATDQWNARGNVVAHLRRKNGDVAEIEGDVADYDGHSGKGAIRRKNAGDLIAFQVYNPPDPETLESLPASRPIRPEGPLRESGTSRTMDWDNDSGEIRLHGDAHILGEDGETWSEHAVYHKDDATVTLTGRRPVLRRVDKKWFGAIQADKIVGVNPVRRVDGDGRVKGWIRFTDNDKAAKYMK